MDYERVKIGTICNLVNGVAFKSSDFQDEGVPVLKIANVKANRVLLDGLKCVSEEVAEKKSRGRIIKGDILLTMTGNRKEGGADSWVGKAALFREDGHYMLNQRLCIVRPDTSIVNVEYLAYCLSAWDAQVYFINHSTSSGGQANISANTINDYEIPLPPLELQEKIAYTLNILDLKQRNNEEINKNLMEQCDSIYRECFVTNVDASWTQGHLSDLITVKYGKDHKRQEDGLIPCYGSGGIMRYVENPLYDKESVLIPRKGTLNNVMYVNVPFWSVDTMFYSMMKKPNIAKFVYHFLKGKDLASMNAGSAVPSMTTDILNAMELTIPSDAALERFETYVQPLYKIIQSNEAENQKSAEIRDTLLPRLLSGEKDVKALNVKSNE